MYWEEDDKTQGQAAPDDVVDLSFRIECRHLPVDHLHALSEAIVDVLPWLVEEQQAGLHEIHIPDAANGWERPQDPDALLHLSKRTRLVLRVPRHRVEGAHGLTGAILDIKGQPMTVGKATEKPLSSIPTLYARYLISDEASTEEDFLAESARQLKARGIRLRKMLCGKTHRIQTPEGELFARSLMLAELSREDSFALQRQGLGDKQHMGCGLFIPHKDIAEVRPGDDPAS